MSVADCKKFKGEIENYLQNDQESSDSKTDSVFSSLRIRTLPGRTGIVKEQGFHAAHLLFILFMLPLMKLGTVHSFCGKQWDHWSSCGKDAFYRFKRKACRWRTFMNKLSLEIFYGIELDKCPHEESYFVVDDTLLEKLGKKMENVSHVFDHNLGRSVLGFRIVTLGLLTGNGFYVVDFAYGFGKKRNSASPEKIGDPRSVSGQRSFEAKNYTKPELALMMIETAVSHGICPGYVLFDSWYAWPWLINGIRSIGDRGIHVICRLKNSNVRYLYKGKLRTLAQLYKKVRKRFGKDKKTGLLLARITVRLPDSDEDAVIVFSKGYKEPGDDTVTGGKKKKKKEKWAAFLSTNTAPHSSTVIRKYTKRWATEVCHRECKQMLALGKDQSNNFNARVFATTASFMRYNLLNYLNEKENHATPGTLFEHLADDCAVISYSQRLWDFFRGLFVVSFESIFSIFETEGDFQTYIEILTDALKGSTPIGGCET
ncbi:transposase [Desulfobacterales bacterium HSG2]|nr:transposase [Desulfobacterales bacterium HSG2]